MKAARIDGAGFFTIFTKILLPVSLPIFMVCLIWQFTQIWNDFLFGIVFSGVDSMPITVALNNLVNTSTGVKEYNVDMAGAIIAALPTLLVYIVAGRYFVRGLTAGAVKGKRGFIRYDEPAAPRARRIERTRRGAGARRARRDRGFTAWQAFPSVTCTRPTRTGCRS